MKVGRYIKEARIKKGMTQEELALKTNINIRTIQRIENDEVTARAYTLRIIAEVLNIDLAAVQPDELQVHPDDIEQQNKTMLVLLHLSGLLLLPALMIWLFEKGTTKGVREHGIDVINFQLSMLVILLPLLLLPALAILIAIFTTVVVLVNTIKVAANKPYHYPLTISFLKKQQAISMPG